MERGFISIRFKALLLVFCLSSLCDVQGWNEYPAHTTNVRVSQFACPEPREPHTSSSRSNIGAFAVSNEGNVEFCDFGRAIDDLQEQITELEESYDRLTRDNVLRPRWKERFEFKSHDGDFRLVFGARVENDYAAFDIDDALQAQFGPIDGGSEFRRARLVAAAKLYDNFNFFSQYDFSTGRVRFASVFLGISNLPYFHNIRIGQFEEPLGLERLTSHRFITFMERGLTNAITPVRSTGLMFHDSYCNSMGTWWIGYFRESNSVGFTQGDGGDALTTRLTRLLVYRDEGRKLLHLGGAYSFRRPLEGEIRFRNRPESNLSERFVDTGEFEAEYIHLFATELAAVMGPWSIQGEYIFNNTEAASGESLNFSAFYFYMSWFLTGENRTYSRTGATFRRVRPHRNFNWSDCCFRGWGAWELAGRISHVDLNSDSIQGGRETNGTVGVNWYWNPNMRTMFNYVLADRHGIGEANIFQMRMQIDF